MNKPNATVTIEPIGARHAEPREYSVHVKLDFSSSEPRHADRDHVAGIARDALAASLSAERAANHRPRVSDMSTAKRSSKSGNVVVSHIVVGVEGTSVRQGRPASEAIERLRAALADDGYRVAIREKRECAEPACGVNVVIEWDRSTEVPPRWHSDAICGAHNYRTCSKCKSLYMMTSMNAAGQAPSVHCEVCGQVLVEWGSSKIWTAKLVTRGTPPA